MDPKYNGVVWTGSHLLDVCEPDPALIEEKDIARGLARNNRFGGHTLDYQAPYSVAWHSLFCEAVADKMDLPIWARLQALLHDAPEYVLGDMVTPVKVLIPGYEALHLVMWGAIARRFEIPEDWHPAIKEIDAIALEVERQHLVAVAAWDPRPHVPQEWDDLGARWIEFTQKHGHDTRVAAALFRARLSALLEARAEEAEDA